MVEFGVAWTIGEMQDNVLEIQRPGGTTSPTSKREFPSNGSGRMSGPTWGFGLGPNQGDNTPTAFINYILFDLNYKVVTMGWTAVPSSANFTVQQITIPQVVVKEAGYIFAYLSYEGQSNNHVYFDDFKVTHTKSNLIQASEYYPFGMQTARSWTRENTLGTNYLGNGGTELNSTSNLYDLEFRNYDPVLGRMNGVDPMAAKYASLTPYNYAFNDPVSFNDVSGADPDPNERRYNREVAIQRQRLYQMMRGGHVTNNLSRYYAFVEGGLSAVPYSNAGGMGGGMTGAQAAALGELKSKAIAGDPAALAEYGRVYGESTIDEPIPFLLSFDGQLFGAQLYSLQGAPFAMAYSKGYEYQGGLVADGPTNIVEFQAQVCDEGVPDGLQYNEALDTWLTAAGGIAGAFESGSAIGTAQSLGTITYSTVKTGLKITKGLGTVGGVLTIAVAGHEVLTGHDNTHTWVDVGMTSLGIGVVAVVGTAALPAVAVIGLGYGIWSAVGGSDWIDRNWGYREPK